MNSNYYKIILKFLHIKYGKDLILKGCPVIFNKSGASMSFGSGVTIYAYSSITIGGNVKF